MEKRSPTAAEFDRILDAAAWSEFGTPLAALGELRERHPVCRYEGGVVDPFWMITRHADVESISRDATPGLVTTATSSTTTAVSSTKTPSAASGSGASHSRRAPSSASTWQYCSC